MGRLGGPSDTERPLASPQVEFAGTERFHIRRRIGEGGMGVVYEALDREHNVRVALKTLRSVDADNLRRFRNEFRALHDLEHPNLVSLGELVEASGTWFYTMELIHGCDFLRYVRPAGPAVSAPTVDIAPPMRPSQRITLTAPGPTFDERKLRAALKQLACGVAALHRAEQVHRDIKPSNVMVADDGRVVLLDFGVVTPVARDRQSKQLHIVGTVEYMAPEQAASQAIGPAADWYSVGVVLYEALTGRLPHAGRTSLELLMHKQQYPAPPPRQLVADLPEDLDALCVELLATDPDKRPPVDVILARLGVDAGELGRWPRRSTSSVFTQRMPFVGREDELSALRAAFDASLERPVTVIVDGPSGVGKSALVAHFRELLADELPDVVFLEGRCYERESVAYKGLDGVADELAALMSRLPKVETALLVPTYAALLPRLFPALQRVELISRATAVPEVRDPQEMQRFMFDAMRELLTRLAQQRPLVVVLDDVQWADADSLLLLQAIVGHASPPPMLLISTARAGLDRDDSHLAVVEELPNVRRVSVGQLPPVRAQELTRLLLPRADEALLVQVATETGGHPLFIQELSRYVEASGDVAGVSLDQSLWERICQLAASPRRLLEVICVAGEPISQEVAALAAETDDEAYRKAVAVLRVAFLVRTEGVRRDDRVAPYHDRIRELVAGRLEPDDERALAERLAIALESTGAAATNPYALVRFAEASGDAARAARYAMSAAVLAADSLAFERAASLYQRALQLGGYTGETLREVRLALAATLVNCGRGAEAADQFIAAADGADPTTRLDCHRQAAEQLMISGHIERGMQSLRDLLREIGVALPATPRRALASVLWHRARLRVRGLGWKPRHENEIASSDLTRLEVYKAVNVGLNMADTIRGADFQARGLLLALQLGEPRRIARALGHEACYLAAQNARGQARALELVATCARIAEDHDDPYARWWSVMARALIAYFSGAFTECYDRLVEAEPMLQDHTVGKTWELNTMRLFRLFVLRRTGGVTTLSELAPQYIRDARRRGDRYTEASMRRTLVTVHFAHDRPDLAHRNLSENLWVPPEGGFHLQHWYELESRCELAMFEDKVRERRDELERSFTLLRSSMLLRVQLLRTVTTWMRARMELSEAVRAADPGARRRAAKHARAMLAEDMPYATVWGHLVRAGAAHLDGDDARAVADLRRAAELAEAASMTADAAAAHWHLASLLDGEPAAAARARAQAWIDRHQVVDPARFFLTIAPGFRA